MINRLRKAAEEAYNTRQDVQVSAGLILALLDRLEAAEKDAARIRNAALEDCADVCQKAGYLAMDIHIRDLIRKSKQQVFADVIGKMKK